MALLEDPTIQRILNEVNKAATGGVLGSAGNYIPEPTNKGRPPLPTMKQDFFNQQQQQQQQYHQAPLFYPTPDMFSMNGMHNFDPNLNLPAMDPIVPIATPSNFDLYSTGLYNTMPSNVISPYENYKHEMMHPMHSMHQARTTSIVSSTNNDILSEQHRHLEYPTIPPNMTTTIPNLGLNLRASSPPLDSIPVHMMETRGEEEEEEELIMDPGQNIPTDTATASMDLIADKDDSHSISAHENEEINPPHLASAGRIFYDPNPQIIQRKGSNSVTYKQNIIVRFLQPPPIANAGPLVIKEVSSQQQAPLPPLVIKQRPTPPKTPPPLVIREKPPPLPSSLATKVITRQLPPEPAPARAVIIERLPPLPPKPRDIIIERWLPYEIVNQKRKVIVERVQKTANDQAQPKNVIITYEPVYAKVERHFQKQNVIREDPQEYLNRFGDQLCDLNEVFRQARAAGVSEDLNPPDAFLRMATALSTNNVAIGTDYDQPSKPLDDPFEEQINVEHQHHPHAIEEEEIFHPPPQPSIEMAQDEDVLVEENVTPFYMNSGENLEETLHRLGIDLPKNNPNEHHF